MYLVSFIESLPIYDQFTYEEDLEEFRGILHLHFHDSLPLSDESLILHNDESLYEGD